MLWKTIFINCLEGNIRYTDLNEELTRDFEIAIMLHVLTMILLTLSTKKGFLFKDNILVNPSLYRNSKIMWINQWNNFSRTELHYVVLVTNILKKKNLNDEYCCHVMTQGISSLKVSRGVEMSWWNQDIMHSFW